MEKYKDRKVLLPSEAGALVGDDIYFFSSKYNLLYKVHMPDFNVSIISHIPCKEIFAFGWFRKIRYWNRKLICIPAHAEKIWIYGLDSKEWDSIDIDFPQLQLKFWGAVIYQDNAFLFGERYLEILKIDLNDYSISHIRIAPCPGYKRDGEGLFLTDAIKVNNIVFSPVSVSNYVLQFNLDTLEYRWKRIGSEGNQYSGINYDGKYFWISPGQKGNIVKWDYDFRWKEFEVPEEIANRSYQFIGVICDESKIRFLTQQDGKSLEINNESFDRNQSSLTEATKSYIHLENYENGTIVLMQSNAHLIIKWNGKWIEGRCEINYENFKEYFRENLLWDNLTANEIEKEDEIFEIDDYVKAIIKQKENVGGFFIDAGMNIWKMVRR